MAEVHGSSFMQELFLCLRSAVGQPSYEGWTTTVRRSDNRRTEAQETGRSGRHLYPPVDGKPTGGIHLCTEKGSRGKADRLMVKRSDGLSGRAYIY